MQPRPVSSVDLMSWLKRVGFCFVIPIAIILLIPAVLLLVLALYLAAIYHATRQIIGALCGMPVPPEYAKPHFLAKANIEQTSPYDADRPT